MSYRNQYSGSPWQQGRPPFTGGGYNQRYGGFNNYGIVNNNRYRRNQGYGSNSGGMHSGNRRDMTYGRSSHYMNDRMGGSRGSLQRKRMSDRSHASGPRSKRPNSESDKRSSGKRPRHSKDSRDGRSDEDSADNSDHIDCDAFECWKPSDEEKIEESKENDDQSDSQKENATKKFLCYVCKVKCGSEEILLKHKKNPIHITKIEELLAIRKEKQNEDNSDKKSKESSDDRKKNRKPGNWCTVCEVAFIGSFYSHRQSKDHCKKRDKKYPKCRPCRKNFTSIEEYRDHYNSDDHKQKSAEFHYFKSIDSGSDYDESAIEPMKVPEEELQEVEKMDDNEEQVVEQTEEAKDQDKTDDEKDSDEKDSEEKEEKKEKEEKEVKQPKPKEPKAYGQSFVVPVHGYYCKLCRKFFKEEKVAKFKHCRSIMHYDSFKIAMEKAIEQEEERQKLAEERDKVEKEAAVAAERDAEIAAIERAARDAIKKEQASKKSADNGNNTEDKEDVESNAEDSKSPIDDQSDDAMDDSSTKFVEIVEPEAEEGTEDVAEKESNEDDIKQEADVKSEADVKNEADIKNKADIKNESETKAEPEDEPEEIKEVATSPATKRGRGRGRGRKRR